MTDLKIAKASHDAALFAVKNWHYSRVLPAGKAVRFGVWEDGKFIGVVIFSRGASPNLGKPLGLEQTQVCELTRVALAKHKTPVSQIIASCLTTLRRTQPGIRAVVSFADPSEGHHGGIYQAGNWVYTGRSPEKPQYFIGGRWRHERGAHHHPDRRNAPVRRVPGKHRYVYPLDRAMRRQVAVLSLPYPRAVEDSTVSRGSSTAEGQVRPLPTAPLENDHG